MSSVEVQVVTVGHPWHTETCCICTGWILLKEVAVGIRPTGMSVVTTFMHKRCLEQKLAEVPDRWDVICEQEKNGKGLAAWAQSNEHA